MKPNLKTIAYGLLATSLVALVGCVVTSVYPYYTAKDVVSDPALIGTWAEAGETNAAEKNWQFAAGPDQSYLLTVRDTAEKTGFTAHLFALPGRRYLDALPTKREDDFIPPHYLLAVSRLDGTALELSLLSYGWLQELVKTNPAAIRHVWVDRDAQQPDSGKLVLTADTAELQRFILQYRDDTNAFAETLKLVRQ
ncbi:MAG TPA: hypothetical protein VFV96_10100 [Verrucomicrobiae bacterium]|nr:hypothetical protein [Verrucomicrobiae bacterium]